MKTYKISKEQVKQVIINGQFKAGKFFHNQVASYYSQDNGTCETCVVGAILRAAAPKKFTGFDATQATENLGFADHLDAAHIRGNFLSILSCEFERAEEYVGANSDEMRMSLLTIVEAFCPETLHITKYT